MHHSVNILTEWDTYTYNIAVYNKSTYLFNCSPSVMNFNSSTNLSGRNSYLKT